MRLAHSKQNMLWPQGTSAATTSLSKQTAQSLFGFFREEVIESVGLVSELAMPLHDVTVKQLAIVETVLTAVIGGKLARVSTRGSLRILLAGGWSSKRGSEIPESALPKLLLLLGIADGVVEVVVVPKRGDTVLLTGPKSDHTLLVLGKTACSNVGESPKPSSTSYSPKPFEKPFGKPGVHEYKSVIFGEPASAGMA